MQTLGWFLGIPTQALSPRALRGHAGFFATLISSTPFRHLDSAFPLWPSLFCSVAVEHTVEFVS